MLKHQLVLVCFYMREILYLNQKQKIYFGHFHIKPNQYIPDQIRNSYIIKFRKQLKCLCSARSIATRTRYIMNRAYSSCFMCVIVTCMMRLPLFKIFSNFVNFCPNFQIFCPFLWKIACMPLLSRIDPD